MPGLFPVVLQGGRLSLGTPGALDQRALLWLDELMEVADPRWLVQPVGFCRTAEVELPAHCAVRADPANAELITGHVHEARQRLGRPLVLENVPRQIRIPAPLSETELLNLVCASAGCGLIIDLTALWTSARNLDFDATEWLAEIEPAHVLGLRLSTAEHRNGRWFVGSGPIPSALWELAALAWSRLDPQVLLASHLWDLPHPDVLTRQLQWMTDIITTEAAPGPSSLPA